MAPPGIDVNGFKPHRDGWRRNGYLLSVCRLGDPRKGLDRLVRAYGLMQQLRIDVPPLVLAGRGSLTDSVAREIDKLGNGARVIVESDVRATDLPALYQGASVFLQASHEEGLGLSLLEAMASALPVVATETAGSRETVVDGVTGWLISQARESDIPAAFAQRALQLLDVHTNDFGLKGHHRCVTTFSTAATLKKFTETYASLIPRR
jgi:glycosyltransferase involved in cell wall biosynthesis